MPCDGASPFGWQLAQRGWRNTRLASTNNARDRSSLSAMTAKSATARSWLPAMGGSAGTSLDLQEAVVSSATIKPRRRINEAIVRLCPRRPQVRCLMRMANDLPAVHMGPNDGRDLVQGMFARRYEPRRVVGQPLTKLGNLLWPASGRWAASPQRDDLGLPLGGAELTWLHRFGQVAGSWMRNQPAFIVLHIVRPRTFPPLHTLAVQVFMRIDARASIAAVPGERWWQLLIPLSSGSFSQGVLTASHKSNLPLVPPELKGDGNTSGTNCGFKPCGIVDPPDRRVAVRARKRLVEQDQRADTVQHQVSRLYGRGR